MVKYALSQIVGFVTANLPLFILAGVVILIIWLKPYLLIYDTVIAFCGGLGTGKSYISTKTTRVEITKNRLKTRLYNLFHLRHKLPLPWVYSTIPIKVTSKRYSYPLTDKILTLQERMIPGSVGFLDEIDAFANQWQHSNQNIIDTGAKIKEGDTGLFDEFIRLYRHYNSSEACEAKLIVNTQATSNIITVVRRRINTVYVLSNFRLWKLPVPVKQWQIPLFYTVRVRNVTITDDVETQENGNAEDNTRLMIGLALPRGVYDTHCYRHRVDPLPYSSEEAWKKLTTNNLISAPKIPLWNNCDKEDH